MKGRRHRREMGERRGAHRSPSRSRTCRRRSFRSAASARGSIFQRERTDSRMRIGSAYRCRRPSAPRCCRSRSVRPGSRRGCGRRAASSRGSRGHCRCRRAAPSPAARRDRACNIPARRARSRRGCRARSDCGRRRCFRWPAPPAAPRDRRRRAARDRRRTGSPAAILPTAHRALPARAARNAARETG